MKTLEVSHEYHEWECGDGCCFNWRIDSTFRYDGSTYYYSALHGIEEDNLYKFMEEVLGIKFVENN